MCEQQQKERDQLQLRQQRNLARNVRRRPRFLPAVSVAFLCFAAFGSLPLSAVASTVAGVTLPDRIEASGRTLTLNGMGLRTVSPFRVKVYVAGLYLERRSNSPDHILRSATPKRLVLCFLHTASRSQLSRALLVGIRANGANLHSLQSRMTQLESLMPDVKVNDRIAFDLTKDGVAITLGAVTRSIPGADFARAVLSIWLGPRPPDAGLKAGLLGAFR
jgi:hypothetical protein